jgi:hypothetical protein
MPQVIFGLGIIGLWVAAVIGWIMNIFTLYHMSFANMTGELIVRIIGIFVAPIGAIMGYV